MKSKKTSVVILSLILFTAIATGFSTSFSNSLDGWQLSGEKFTGERTGTESSASHSDKYEGSVKVHVEGAPGGMDLYKVVENPIPKGTEIRVKYRPSTGSWSAGGPALKLRYPDSKNIQLENENEKTTKDGRLTGKVPKKLPEGGTILIDNNVWPGEYTIYFTEVKDQIQNIQPENPPPPRDEDTIFQDDFESDLDGWENIHGKGGDIVEKNGRKSLWLHEGPGSRDSVDNYLRYELDQEVKPNVVEFTVLQEELCDGYCRSNEIMLKPEKELDGTTKNENNLIELDFKHRNIGPGQKVTVNNGGQNDLQSNPFDGGWKTFRLYLDWEQQEIDKLTINGEKKAENIKFKGEVNGIKAIDINRGYYNSEPIWIDNVKMQGKSEIGDDEDDENSSNSNPSFEDGFEDGTYKDKWSIVWKNAGEIEPSNDWKVKDQSDTLTSLEGDKSLYLDSYGDPNIIATEEKVLNTEKDFNLTLEYLTKYRNSRGFHITLLESEKDGSKGNYVESEEKSLLNIGAGDSDFGKYDVVNLLGIETTLDSNSINQKHKVRLTHTDNEYTIYHDGSKIITVNEADDATKDISGSYRLGLRTSGQWGQESEIHFDNININSNSRNYEDDRNELEPKMRIEGCTNQKTPSGTYPTCPKDKGDNVEFEAIIEKSDEVKSIKWGLNQRVKQGRKVNYKLKQEGLHPITMTVTSFEGLKYTQDRLLRVGSSDDEDELKIESLKTSKNKVETGNSLQISADYVNNREPERDNSIEIGVTPHGNEQEIFEKSVNPDAGEGTTTVELQTVRTIQSTDTEGTLRIEKQIPEGIYDIKAKIKDGGDKVSDTETIRSAFEVTSRENSTQHSIEKFMQEFVSENEDYISLSPVKLEGSEYRIVAVKGKDEPGNEGFVRAQLSVNDDDWETFDQILVIEKTKDGFTLVEDNERIEEAVSIKSALYWSKAFSLEEPNEWAVETNRHMLYGDIAYGYNAFISEGTKEALFKTDKERYKQVLTKMVSSGSDNIISENNLEKIQNAKDLASAAKEAENIASNIEGDSKTDRIRKKILEETGVKLTKISDETEKVDAVMPIVSLVVEISTQEEYSQRKVERLSRVADYSESRTSVNLDPDLKKAIREIEERESTEGKTSEMIVSDFISWSKDEGVDLAKYGGQKFAESGMADDLGSYMTSHSTTLSSATSSSTLSTLSSVATAGGAALQGWELGGVATSRGATYEALKKAEYSRKTMQQFGNVSLDIKQHYGTYSNINNDYGETALGSDTKLSKDYMAARFLRRRSMCEFNNQMLNSMKGVLNWIPDATNWFEEQYAKYDEDWNPRDEKEMMEREVRDCRRIAEWMRTTDVQKIKDSYPKNHQNNRNNQNNKNQPMNLLIGSIGQKANNLLENYVFR